MLKIMDIAAVPTAPMEGRGMKKRLIDKADGTHAIDVHINTLMPGGARGRLHKHSVADNVYIVREGVGQLTVEDKTYTIKKDQVIFIPAGLRHSLSNVSDQPFEIFEIYAPAGDQFDFIHCD